MLLLTPIVATGLMLAAPRADVSGEKAITLEQTSRRPDAERLSLTPTLPRWSWAWDGEHLALSGGEGGPEWYDPRTGAKVEVEPREGADEDALARRALELEEQVDRVGNRPAKVVEKIADAIVKRPEQVSDDGTARLVYVENEL